MFTNAYFDEIQEKLIIELSKAQNSIIIAIAWFTDRDLFDIVLKKSKSGIYIQLILSNDSVNKKSELDFELLSQSGGEIYWVGGTGSQDLMHNKFCVIDRETVITGSYNWTKRAAEKNYENITVIEDCKELAEQFINEFERLRDNKATEVNKKVRDNKSVSKRLETIINLIELKDLDDIRMQIEKLKKFQLDPMIFHIINLLESRSYGDAVKYINIYLNQFKNLIVYEDPEIFALKIEVNALENKIDEVSNQKAELNKEIYDFGIKYNNAVGTISNKIYQIKRDIAKFRYEEALKNKKNDKISEIKEEYEKAEEDYSSFNNSYKELKNEKINELNEDQKVEIKKLYRESAKICHPDKVKPELKSEAERIFKDLQNAYQSNDLISIKRIYNSLISNDLLVYKSITINEKVKLRELIEELKQILNKLKFEIEQLKSNSSYKIIKQYANIDEYLMNRASLLKTELEKLTKEAKDLGLNVER